VPPDDDIGFTRPTRTERKENEAMQGVNGPVGVRNGQQCINHVVDQNWVMALLNQIPSVSGGTLTPSGPTRFKAPREHFCDPTLSDAIKRFQQANGLTPDGVVDPGGPSLMRMRALASGRFTSVASGSEEQFKDKLQEFLNLLPGLGPLLKGAPEGLQIQGAIAELERLAGQAGVRRQPGPLPVRNNLAVGVGVVIVVVIGCGLIIYAISRDPTWVKSAKGFSEAVVNGIGNAVDNIVRGLGRLSDKILLGIKFGILGVVASAAEIIAGIGNLCGDELTRFRLATTNLSLILNPGTKISPLHYLRAKAWLEAFYRLIDCVLKAGHFDQALTLLKLLRIPAVGALRLIDALVQFLLEGELPPPPPQVVRLGVV
jgi:hypothetical protein